MSYATDEEEESSAKDPGHAKLNQSKKSLLTYRSKSFFANHVEGQMIAGSRSRIGADRVQCSPTKSFSNQSQISQISKVRQCSWEVGRAKKDSFQDRSARGAALAENNLGRDEGRAMNLISITQVLRKGAKS